MVDLPAGWTQADGRLRRQLTFADFSEAWAFMSRVALLAERNQHHPEWTNVWNIVTTSWSPTTLVQSRIRTITWPARGRDLRDSCNLGALRVPRPGRLTDDG